VCGSWRFTDHQKKLIWRSGGQIPTGNGQQAKGKIQQAMRNWQWLLIN